MAQLVQQIDDLTFAVSEREAIIRVLTRQIDILAADRDTWRAKAEARP